MISGGGSSGGSGGKPWGKIVKGIVGGAVIALGTIATIIAAVVGDEGLCKLRIEVLDSFLKCKDEDTKQATRTPPPTFFPSPEPLPSVPSSPTPTKEPTINQNPVTESTDSNINIGVLKESRSLNGRVSYHNQEKYYFFSLDNYSEVSLYLDNVTDLVGMSLYPDTNNNGVIDFNEMWLRRTDSNNYGQGSIQMSLGADNYIVVVKFMSRNSNYNLHFLNKTHEAENVGLLKGTKTYKGSLERNHRSIKYYRFSLSSPSNVSLSLGDVTSWVDMYLYVDTNDNGVIDGSNEAVDGVSASSSSPGTISKTLGRDDYFVVISKRGGNTDYTLTMSAP